MCLVKTNYLEFEEKLFLVNICRKLNNHSLQVTDGLTVLCILKILNL